MNHRSASSPGSCRKIFQTIWRLNAEGKSILLAEQNANMALRTGRAGAQR
jgi:ABC-type branched-subunit amino acid transport system ATPase component